MNKILFLVALVGCSGGDDVDCSTYEPMGAWRMMYDETDGNCGSISDETAIFGGDSSPDPSCSYGETYESEDRCTVDMSWTCPTTDGYGTQSWTFHLELVSETEIVGSATVQVQHPSVGTCRSTYDIRIVKL